MAYLEELRNTAKAFGVDTGTEHMDAIQLYREIAKTLGVDLGTEHKGVVELLALINKALPDALGGGGGILPYGQTNQDLYQYQLIADNTNIEIDCSKLADYFEKNVDRDDVMDISSWAGDSDSSHNEIVVFHPIGVTGSSYILLADSEGLLKLSLEATSGGTLFEVTLGDSGKYSSPLEALRNAGIITINNNMVEEYNSSHATYLPLVVYSVQACDSLEEIANVDFIRIYNV